MNDIAISVHYDAAESAAVQLKLDLDGEPVLQGQWDVTVRYQGKTLRCDGPWTETCTYHENGCDYLEIDIPLTKDYRLQRFFLLDQDDRLLILGDTVLRDGGPAKRPRKETIGLQYESSLSYSGKLWTESMPDSTCLAFCPEKPARATPLFRVLPLALPDEPRQCHAGMVQGELTTESSSLILRQQSSGRSMFAPLFFDLNPGRWKKRPLWRQLTVGENLRRVPDDQAVGYRVQLGAEQYLLYHSMTPMANRTLLGHNLIDDLCFARFSPENGVEPLVEVQQEDDA